MTPEQIFQKGLELHHYANTAYPLDGVKVWKTHRVKENVDDAVKEVRSNKGTNYYVFLFGDGKASEVEKQGVAVIRTKDTCGVYRMNDSNQPIRQLKDVIHGSHNDQKCYERLEANFGKIDEEVLMRDILPAIAMDSNIHDVIYDLSGLKLWIANRKGSIRACDRNYVEFDFARALKKF